MLFGFINYMNKVHLISRKNKCNLKIDTKSSHKKKLGIQSIKNNCYIVKLNINKSLLYKELYKIYDLA